MWANHVGWSRLLAVGAGHQMRPAEGIVGAATVAASFGVFAFGMRGHGGEMLLKRRRLEIRD